MAASPCEAATSHEMKGYWKGLRLDELDLQINSNLFPDQNAPGLQGCVPSQTEILAIYSSGSGQSYPGIPPRIFRWLARTFHDEYDWTGDTVDGQISGHGKFIFAVPSRHGSTGRLKVGNFSASKKSGLFK